MKLFLILLNKPQKRHEQYHWPALGALAGKQREMEGEQALLPRREALQQTFQEKLKNSGKRRGNTVNAPVAAL